jgi:acyl carrier protein
MEVKGVRVVISRGDVSDRNYLEQLFSTFGHSLPGLRGVIHAAGTLDDGVLAQQTWERFEKVMAPKVDGAWHLHSLSKDQSLDFFVLFSSAVSVLGSAGQANHVAACGFEDALAHYRRSLGLHALSVNWGPWGEVGAATRNAVSDRLAMKGFHSIQPPQGLHALEQLLIEDRVQIGVMSVDWLQYVDSLPQGSHSKLFSRVLNGDDAVDTKKHERKTSQSSALLEQLRQAPLRNRRAVLEAHVRDQAIRVLGLSPSFKLDLSQGLATLGMDSLMTIELKNRLQASVGKTLPSTIVFDHPTVIALAEYLEKNVLMLVDPTQQPTAMAAPDKAGKSADDLEHLSDDEAEAILMKELSDSQSAN